MRLISIFYGFMLTAALMMLLFTCQEASAGKWVKTGTTFDRGYYLVCNTFAGFPNCAVVETEGTMDEVDIYIELFNETETVPIGEVYWFHWEAPYWIKAIPPFKYIDDAKCPEGANCS